MSGRYREQMFRGDSDTAVRGCVTAVRRGGDARERLASLARLRIIRGVGMFDTIHFKTPLLCPNCGAEHRSLQTKQFDSIMAHFKIGSVLSGCPVHTGILKEHLWCSACHKAGKEGDSPVYVVIWHSVLAGVEQEVAKAEARLATVDRLDLIGWLDEAQRKAARWRRNYHGLYNDLSCWHEHLARKDETEATGADAERQRAFRGFFGPAEEILAAADPLAAILAKNKHDDEETDD